VTVDEGPREPTPRELQRRRVLKWIGVAVVVPAIAVFVSIMIFVARAELAFDEESCPFERVESRNVGSGVLVHDEMRACQESIVEHRWIVERDGALREIGRRRLPAAAYARDAYGWQAELEAGFVHVAIENAGVESARFRENAPEDRAR
jgi:hypothetical protein